MGLLNFLSSEERSKRRVAKVIRNANNKFKPKEYRQPALSELIDIAKAGNEEGMSGLLSRFSVNAEPSSEDELEKEWACEALVEIGRAALPPIRRSMRSAESISWIQRTLKNIVSADEFKTELLDVLSEFDTEYERNPDRKLQTIAALADAEGDDVVVAIIPFLKDVDETVRFQTVSTLAKQGDDLAREPMLETMCEDESLRVRNETVDAFAQLEWSTKGFKKKVDAILPKGFRHDKSGKIVRLGAQQ
jgi:hypothetical protein